MQMINKSLLPPFTLRLLSKYLLPLNPNIPSEIHLLNINSMLSQVACFSRVKIIDENLEINTFPNIFTATFADSGIGKDKSKRSLRVIGAPFSEAKARRAEKFKEEKLEQLKEIADEKGMKEAAKNKFIRDNMPRRFSFIIGSGTPEGLASDRELLAEAGFGSIHWSCSEFMDYISSGDTIKEAFASMFKEAFDNGDTEAKSIKSNQNVMAVYGVPMTISVHSVADTENQAGFLNPFFERGYARRCFVSCPEKADYKKQTYQQMIAATNSANTHASAIIHDVYNIVKKSEDSLNTYHLSEDAREMYFDYLTRCEETALSTLDVNLRGVADEVRGRAFKMIKLACLIAMQNHKESIITADDVKMAIYQTDFFAAQFKKFYTKTKILDVQRLFDFILANQDCFEISKTVIRRQNFTPKKSADVTRWIEDTTRQLEEYAEESGYSLVLGKKGRAGVTFRVEKTSEQFIDTLRSDD